MRACAVGGPLSEGERLLAPARCSEMAPSEPRPAIEPPEGPCPSRLPRLDERLPFRAPPMTAASGSPTDPRGLMIPKPFAPAEGAGGGGPAARSAKLEAPRPGAADTECLCRTPDEVDAWLGAGDEATELARPSVVTALPLAVGEAAVAFEVCESALACRRAFRDCWRSSVP
jgi:hypothetical protein